MAVAAEEEAKKKAEEEALKAIAREISVEKEKENFVHPEIETIAIEEEKVVTKPETGSFTKVDNVRVIKGLPGDKGQN